MRCRPTAAPLAVWTFAQAGEEVASGDPSITDQQRSAAGRETVAERSAALLESNHHQRDPVRARGS